MGLMATFDFYQAAIIALIYNVFGQIKALIDPHQSR
jgi:hypothetical protein